MVREQKEAVRKLNKYFSEIRSHNSSNQQHSNNRSLSTSRNNLTNLGYGTTTSIPSDTKYVDIEVINKNCNIHRGTTPTYLGRRGSLGSNYSTSTGDYGSLPRRNKQSSIYGNNKNQRASSIGSNDGINDSYDSYYNSRRRQSEGYLHGQHSSSSTLQQSSTDKLRKKNSSVSNLYNKNIEHPSSFPSLLRTFDGVTVAKQKESIASQVAAEVIAAAAAAQREREYIYGSNNNLRHKSVSPAPMSRHTSSQSIINGNNGNSKLIKSRPSFGSTTGNIYTPRRDSSSSVKSSDSKRNSIDTAYSSRKSSLQRESVPRDYVAVNRKGSSAKDGNGTSGEFSDSGESGIRIVTPNYSYSAPPRNGNLSKPTTTTTTVITHSILRKSLSPNVDESDSSAGGESKLTKENLTRHVRILEDEETSKRHQLLENDDMFKEYVKMNAGDRRISADSLDVRKTSLHDISDIDEFKNISLNTVHSQIQSLNKCESPSTDNSSSVRDYYNIPKINKYSRSTTNSNIITNNNNNNNSNTFLQKSSGYSSMTNDKFNFEFQCQNGSGPAGIRKSITNNSKIRKNGQDYHLVNNNNNNSNGFNSDFYSKINTNSKKNSTISKSVDDLRINEHLFSYDSKLNKIGGKLASSGYGGQLSSVRNGYISNQMNSNINQKFIHNYPKQKSALYHIKNKHYSMDNLLAMQQQIDGGVGITRNQNNTNNNSGQPFQQCDVDRPQFVSVTTLIDCQAIRCAEFHPHGRVYAIGSNSKTLRICEYPSLLDVREDHTTYQPSILYEKSKYHKGSIYCMDWSPDGELIATGSNDKTIKLMRYNESKRSLEGREVELTMHDGTIRDLCFIEDSTNKASLLISGGAGDNKIYVTDCGTATPFQALSGHGGHVLSLYNWGGAMFVSGSNDKTIRFWDLRTRSCVNTVTPATHAGSRQGSPVASVSVDPSGRLLVSGHEDSSCVLYDIRGNRPIQCFKPHMADIRSIRFSPSAYYLLTAGYDKKLVLTDLQGDLTLPLPSVVVAHHADKVISGRWHPTDFSFLSTSADKTAVCWALSSKP